MVCNINNVVCFAGKRHQLSRIHRLESWGQLSWSPWTWKHPAEVQQTNSFRNSAEMVKLRSKQLSILQSQHVRSNQHERKKNQFSWSLSKIAPKSHEHETPRDIMCFFSNLSPRSQLFAKAVILCLLLFQVYWSLLGLGHHHELRWNWRRMVSGHLFLKFTNFLSQCIHRSFCYCGMGAVVCLTIRESNILSFQFKGIEPGPIQESFGTQDAVCSGTAGVNTPYAVPNQHIAKCGFINVFHWQQTSCLIYPFWENLHAFSLTLFKKSLSTISRLLFIEILKQKKKKKLKKLKNKKTRQKIKIFAWNERVFDGN